MANVDPRSERRIAAAKKEIEELESRIRELKREIEQLRELPEADPQPPATVTQ